MAPNDASTRLESDLSQAIDELQTSLHAAAQATTQIRDLLPRLSSITSLFDELDSVIRSGRAQIGAAGPSGTTTYTRPTLVVPSATPAPEMKADDPWSQVATAWSPQDAASTETAFTPVQPEDIDEKPPVNTAGLVCFRLEFRSTTGPLDLRSVDDAVSDHPAVRDVALLDYDGRTATLKVWIESSASPADVQSALVDRSVELFGENSDVTIVALEEAA